MSNINTKQVRDRRIVRLHALQDALAEARSLAAIEREGRLISLGNWTLGQAVNHLAVWAEFAFKPTPLPPPPWIVRRLARLFKKRILEKGLSPGFQFRSVNNGTLGTEIVPTSVALDRYTASLDRLSRDEPTQPSNALGSLTQAESIQLQLRHAELHLSFFKPA